MVSTPPPPPPPDFRGDLEHIEYWILGGGGGGGGGASIFFCIYLIIACNIDFLSILKKIWEMWDFSKRKYGTNMGFLGSF